MPPDGAHLLDGLEQAVATLATVGTVGGADQEIARVAARVEDVEALLKGSPGGRALLCDRALFVGVEHHVEQLQPRPTVRRRWTPTRPTCRPSSSKT